VGFESFKQISISVLVKHFGKFPPPRLQAKRNAQNMQFYQNVSVVNKRVKNEAGR
jgi:hypothetical protein